uniref:Plastid-encoded DNA-directed RNA polymerase beta''B n=1 Tax=Nephromyces sp. ex Molgula occidentalis TaxID=2544991 RepID=A0A5C1H7J1_9APIC|nr:plastid-encoded DNA-directed RNA polymerase beta''B [Nephromyces sp. ex Molgula occidentalis]
MKLSSFKPIIIKNNISNIKFILKFSYNFLFRIILKSQNKIVEINLFNYLKYFLNKYNNINLVFFKDSYEFINNKFNNIHISKIKNFYPIILESKNYKLLGFNFYHWNISYLKKINNIFLINKGNSYNILHKYILSYENNLHFYNTKYSSFSPKQKNIYLILYNFNKKYKNLIIKNNNLNFTNIIKNSLLDNIKYINKTKDIISGLQHIETIFESKYTKYNSIIITKGYLIDKILCNNYDILNNIFITKILIFNNFKKYIINFENFITKNLLLVDISSIIKGGDLIQFNIYSPQLILDYKFLNLQSQFNLFIATKISFIFIQFLIVESLYKQYLSNNINVPIIHFEWIIKKMTSCVKIDYTGESSFNISDIISFNLIHLINLAYTQQGYKEILYKPLVLGVSKSILAYSGFLTAASFQETIKILLKSSLENQIDWLVDLKTKVILSDLINTGAGWYRFFNSFK